MREAESFSPFLNKHYLRPQRLTEAQLLLTHKCNLQCLHCNIVNEQRSELTTEQWQKVLRELKDLGTLKVIFSGGEPSLHPGLLQLLEDAHELGFGLTLYTNARHWPVDFLERVQGWRWDMIAISVYDINPDRHDKITKVPGSWERATQNLERLVALNLPAAVNHVRMRGNTRDEKQLEAWADQRGLQFRSSDIILPTIYGGTEPFKMRVEKQIPLSENLPVEEPIERQQDCGCLEISNMINAYGDVFPCPLFPVPLGNLNHQGLREIWQESPLAPVIRRGLARATAYLPCVSCFKREDCRHCYGLALLEEGSAYLIPRTRCKRNPVPEKRF